MPQKILDQQQAVCVYATVCATKPLNGVAQFFFPVHPRTEPKPGTCISIYLDADGIKIHRLLSFRPDAEELYQGFGAFAAAYGLRKSDAEHSASSSISP